MKVIIVGGGGPTRELLRRLGDGWEVAVVESSAETLDRVRGVRPIQAIRGDGTSRLVLERAGLGEADALVAATNDDEANLEVCRIGKDAATRRVIAVAADPERIGEFRELGVDTFSPDSIAARRLEENLEPRRITSQSFAHGRAEAIELEVTSRSPVHGKSLKELHARSWVVGAILREGKLLIPHGDTVLQDGDLVTVVGAGAEFAEICRTFTSSQPRFPLDYGKHVLVLVEEKQRSILPEATHLVRNSRATGLLFIHRNEEALRDTEEATRLRALRESFEESAGGVEVRLRPVRGKPNEEIDGLIGEESIGIFVRRSARRMILFRIIEAARAVTYARRVHRPVLLARGSHPYRRILIPSRRTPAGRAAARAAFDLAVRGKAGLTALAAIDPVFLAGPDAALEGRRAMGWLREEAAMLGLTFEGEIRKGNPIRLFLEAIRENDLLVLGISESRRTMLPISVVDQLAARAPVSVLLVPTAEQE